METHIVDPFNIIPVDAESHGVLCWIECQPIGDDGYCDTCRAANRPDPCYRATDQCTINLAADLYGFLDRRPATSPDPYHLPKGSDWNAYAGIYKGRQYPQHPDDR